MKELATITSGKFQLFGIWDLPDSAAPWPAVIFCHGFTGHHIESRRYFSRLTERLSRAGIACFRFDHRGCGDSTGDFLDFDPDGLLTDSDAALEAFLANPQIDPSRLGVVGYSLGGATASYLLSRHPSFLTASIWAGVSRPEIIRDRLSTLEGFHLYMKQGYFDYGGFRVSPAYIDEICKLRPLEWIHEFQRPIFFLQGSDDTIVVPEQVYNFQSVRSGKGDKVLLIEGADHAFTPVSKGDQLVDHTFDWLRSRLLEKASTAIVQ